MANKSREEMLREEVRFYADLTSRFLQWGITVLVSLQTALYFVRHERMTSLVEAKKLAAGEEVPIGFYLLGTGFLFIVATIIAALTGRAVAQYRSYKQQLLSEKESGIKDDVIRRTTNWGILLYYVFPLVDLASRFIIKSIRIELM